MGTGESCTDHWPRSATNESRVEFTEGPLERTQSEGDALVVFLRRSGESGTSSVG